MARAISGGISCRRPRSALKRPRKIGSGRVLTLCPAMKRNSSRCLLHEAAGYLNSLYRNLAADFHHAVRRQAEITTGVVSVARQPNEELVLPDGHALML